MNPKESIKCEELAFGLTQDGYCQLLKAKIPARWDLKPALFRLFETNHADFSISDSALWSSATIAYRPSFRL
jgi:hypothetical protein